MPRKKWIDKKSATSFALVHRAQNDPKIHDAEASDMVFQEVAAPNSNKIKSCDDLEEELGLDPRSVRHNEGEAAEYGVYYDDTDYDYMQHMKDLGGSTEAYFMEAPQVESKQKKGKGKQKLEDALRDASLEDEENGGVAGGVKLGGASELLDADILPSRNLRKGTYMDQQNVPDALAGFQPDMDPRLREVLEALEDEAYVDDEDDVFGELAKGGEEVSLEEFEELGFVIENGGDEDEGWETDDTAKPAKEYSSIDAPPSLDNQDVMMDGSAEQGPGDWMKEFSKFKERKKQKPLKTKSELESSVMTGSSMTGSHRKKRKGAMTSSTGYSMTSSSLFRTEGLTLLDDRFDKIEEDYAEDEMDDGVSVNTSSSIASQGPVRSDFDSIMDEFLGGYSMSGKKRLKKGGFQSGMEQLDEVRQGLGPARILSQKV
ncbi:MAG: hypothetical protein M1830_003313 [Pleopsidium flavum]|nr:MAG: hypothetical protein M1830_003313 [Pleopsidium flavum]